jgi:hypothetical protein
MRNKWLWKPVVVGAILFGLLGCLFTGWMVAALDCPGLKWECLSRHSLTTDLIGFGLLSLLIGGLIGACLGVLFALIRNMIRKKE